MKKLEWNTCLTGNEDWNAAMDSEVFRNYLNIIAAEEAKEKEEEAEGNLNPIKMNKDYVKAEEEDDILEGDDEISDDDVIPEDEDVGTDADYSDYTDADFEELYGETGAGESKFIDTGLTTETLNEVEGPIDYADDEPYFNASKSSNQTEAITHVMDTYKEEESKEEELEEVEKNLGLDTNVAYQFSQLIKRYR